MYQNFMNPMDPMGYIGTSSGASKKKVMPHMSVIVLVVPFGLKLVDHFLA